MSITFIVSLTNLGKHLEQFYPFQSCSPSLVGANHEPDDELKGEEDDHDIVDHLDDEDDPGVFHVSVIVLKGRD